MSRDHDFRFKETGFTENGRMVRVFVALGLEALAETEAQILALLLQLVVDPRPDALTPDRTFATATRTMTDGAMTVAALETRPLEVPRLPHGDSCPTATVTGRIAGGGPAVEVGPAAVITSKDPALFYGKSEQGWHRAKVLWLLRVDQPGPVIVRGTRIDDSGAVRWVYQGTNETLQLSGTDTLNAAPEWRHTPSAAKAREAGCYAFQIDGTDFQSILILRAESARAA